MWVNKSYLEGVKFNKMYYFYTYMNIKMLKIHIKWNRFQSIALFGINCQKNLMKDFFEGAGSQHFFCDLCERMQLRTVKA